MKRVIEGKIYDTNTAEEIHSWESAHMPGDFHYYSESLFVTPRGNFFVAGEGGAMSPYSESLGSGSYGGGSGIRPLGGAEAARWLEEHGGEEILVADVRFAEFVEQA